MIGTIASVGDRRTALNSAVLFLIFSTLGAAATGGLVGALGTAIGFDGVAVSLASVAVLVVLMLALVGETGGLVLPWPFLHRQVDAGTWDHRGAVAASAL